MIIKEMIDKYEERLKSVKTDLKEVQQSKTKFENEITKLNKQVNEYKNILSMEFNTLTRDEKMEFKNEISRDVDSIVHQIYEKTLCLKSDIATIERYEKTIRHYTQIIPKLVRL